MITITEENIVELEIDAIVNAAHVYLSGGGGVDGAIHRAAGLELYEACAEIGFCDVGEAVITPGFNLKAKYIIHTVGPFYSKLHSKKCEEQLTNCYENSLDLARDNEIHSIAFPCISSGLYGYPIEESAEIAFRTVKRWLEENDDYELEVRLVCYTDKEFEVYEEVVNRINEEEQDQEDDFDVEDEVDEELDDIDEDEEETSEEYEDDEDVDEEEYEDDEENEEIDEEDDSEDEYEEEEEQ